MARLGKTTAKLVRNTRHWQKLFESAAKASDAARRAVSPGRLTEVAGFGGNPGQLRMLAYVPEKLPPGSPLVVILHGCTQTGEDYDTGAGWSVLADRLGFAVLAPEQQRANNQNLCFNWFLPGDTKRGGGEAASIRQMTEHMIRAHSLDRSRIFVTGLSAGGAMTAAMLATYPELFAGGAIIGGLPYGAAKNVQEAFDAMFQGNVQTARERGGAVRRASSHQGRFPRVAIWHGSADTTVRPVNAEELVKQWTDVHGLNIAAAEASTIDGQHRQAWRDAEGTILVESYAIAGLGHGTPLAASGEMALGKAGAYMLEAGISSTYRIAEFWGLTEKSAAAATRPAKAAPVLGATAAQPRLAPGDPRPGPAQASSGQFRPGAAASKAGRIDPQAVISKALRAAGLMK